MVHLARSVSSVEVFLSMNRSLRILIISDSEEETGQILHAYQRCGYEPIYQAVHSPAEMRVCLSDESWDLIIATDTLPHFNVSSAIKIWRNSSLDLPLFLVSSQTEEEMVVAAMKAGARDCILMDHLARLIPATERELREVEQRHYQRRVEATVRHIVYHDHLTDLPNQILLQERMSAAVKTARREKRHAALLIVDINRFKAIIDTLGRTYGDLLLKQMGLRLKSTLPESAMLFRMGGDEFAVLLPKAESAEATNVALALISAMEPPFLLEEIQIDVGIHIGIAQFPDHAEYADLLIRRADTAMYAAKESEQGYLSYAQEMDRTNPRQLDVMRELRHAISRDELFLVFQPKINLKTGAAEGVEALVRWKHPEQDILSPDQFISLAEQCGLIKPITLWVIEAALNQCCLCHRLGQNIGISVNLSLQNMRMPHLIEEVARLLKAYNIPPGLLTLEIAEITLLDNPRPVIDLFARFKRLGVRLSIDNFGIGHTSLGDLKQLPLDEIKIDRSFVMNMKEQDLMIVRSIITLAHNLGLKVVATGIEQKNILDQLAGLGCNGGQGDYLSGPLIADELPLWLIETAPQKRHSLWREIFEDPPR